MSKKYRIYKIINYIIFLFLPLLTLNNKSTLLASENVPLALDQCINKALNYSPNLAAARSDLEAAIYRYKEIVTGFMPTLTTEYNYYKTQSITRIKTKVGTFYTGSLNTYQWTTSLSQPVFTGFKLSALYKIANLGINYSNLLICLAKLDIAYSTKKAFFEYLKNQKILEVANQQLLQLSSHLKAAKVFFEVGILPQNDVLKVEVELAEAMQQQVQAENDVSAAKANLNILLGQPIEANLKIIDVLNRHKITFTYEEIYKIAFTNRPELKGLAIQLEQAKENIHQAQSAYYPQVNLQANYIFTGENWNFENSNLYDTSNWQIITQVNWPFWEWGRTFHQVNQKRANVRKIEAVQRELRDQIDLQIKQSWLAFKASEKNINTALTSILSAEENFRIAQERFKEQLATNTEVLDAQTLLSTARNNYYNALTQHNLAEASLLRAMGCGLPKKSEEILIKND